VGIFGESGKNIDNCLKGKYDINGFERLIKRTKDLRGFKEKQRLCDENGVLDDKHISTDLVKIEGYQGNLWFSRKIKDLLS